MLLEDRMLASQQVRQNIRQGLFTQPTAGAAPGFVQANLVVLPKSLAADFLLFVSAIQSPVHYFPSLIQAVLFSRVMAMISTSVLTFPVTEYGETES